MTRRAEQPRLSVWRRFAAGQSGTATVEFVIMVPIVLTILLSAVDFAGVMIRQVFLERAVDLAVRDVRLGNVPVDGFHQFRTKICDGTALLPNCEQSISVQMVPINTTTFAGLHEAVECVDRENDITPELEFNPGSGAQELMLLRICVVSDPFLDLTAFVMGMQRNHAGDYVTIVRSIFVNEARA